MDNSNVSSSGQNDTAPSVVQADSQPVVQQPVAVGGIANKEFGPSMVSTHEIMQPAGEHVEPVVSPEVKEAGVTAVKEVPDLTLHDQKMGVQLAKESVPHPTSPSGIVSYPMTEGEAKELVKHKNVKSSWYWAAVAVLKQIHKKLLNP